MSALGRPTIGAELIDVGNHSALLMYRLVHLSADFDESGEWARDAPSGAHWIASRLHIEVSTAREWVRIGKKLREYSILDEAFASGRLSYSKVRTLSRFVRHDNEAEVCSMAETVPAGNLGVALAAWSARHDDEDEIKGRQQRDRFLSCRTEPDGSLTGSFRLPALGGATTLAAIDALVKAHNHASADASGGAPRVHGSVAQQRADALVALAAGGGLNVKSEIVIHVRGDGISFDDGSPISGSIVEALAPESFFRVMLHDAQSRPTDASDLHRYPTKRQKRLVKERDRKCVDCGGNDAFAQYDHKPPYDETHHTVVHELEYRCSRCHRRRHGGGQVKRRD